jgi:hypothetical protein
MRSKALRVDFVGTRTIALIVLVMGFAGFNQLARADDSSAARVPPPTGPYAVGPKPFDLWIQLATIHFCAMGASGNSSFGSGTPHLDLERVLSPTTIHEKPRNTCLHLVSQC